MKPKKRSPTHPGTILKYYHLNPLGISITEMADRLGISRKTLSKILNQRGAITVDMALRLSRAFGTTPHFWLNMQLSYDLWHAEQEGGWQDVEKIAS